METRRIDIPKGVTSIEIAFEQADQGPGCIEVPLTAENTAKGDKNTGLDLLRLRGTPIELIGSAIIAKDWKTAHAAFRTSVLEYIYEKIAALADCRVQFVNSQALQRHQEKENKDQLGLTIEGDSPFGIIGLTTAHYSKTYKSNEAGPGRLFAPLCKVESGVLEETIGDSVQATVLGIIENISGNIFSEISMPLSKVRGQYCGPGKLSVVGIHVRIVVDLFEFELTGNEKYIKVHANVPMLAFWHSNILGRG